MSEGGIGGLGGTVPSLAATAAVARADGASLGETVTRGTSTPTVTVPAEPSVRETRVAASRRWEVAATKVGAQADPVVARGTLLGRYVVLDTLGAGAMGVVFAAFDPELDRKVAIKLLLSDGASASASVRQDGRARLVREALALAKLSHPNVVAIFDVGTHGEAVWIAMELVEGRTLRDWLGERPRAWQEVLAVMLAAGSGLAAAHAAGLVHRDMKPDNVMIAGDGRVRVMDFGLARREASGEDGPAATGSALLGALVTQVGSLIGTPAYMASEQLRGEHAGAPADVFAFCVMLWEGLHGARPFVGETIDDLQANVAAGRVVAPPPGRRAPRWLIAALTRGLAPDPRRRWPGMAALLTELEHGQTRAGQRRRRGLIGATLAGAVAAGLVSAGWQRADLAARVARCEGLGAQIDAVWDAAARTRLATALDGSPIAGATASRTTPWLDAWAAEWRRVRVDTCTQHAVTRAWSADLRARADECLDERLLGFTALLAVLTDGDEALQAVDAAAGLVPASACGDAEQLARRPVLPAAELGRLRGLRPRLARVGALELAGKYRDGLASARETLTAAEAVAWAPAVAEARLHVGILEGRTGQFDDAARTLEEAYFAASRASADLVAVDAATWLVTVVGNRQARVEDGLHWARLAELGLWRLGSDGRTVRDAALLNSRGLVRQIAGDFPGALADLTAARSIEAAAQGPDHPSVATTTGNLAVLQGRLGDPAQELASLTTALAAHERAFGPDHPKVADLLNNLATARARAGDLDGAIGLYTRALAIRERALGPDHPDVADTLANIASARFLRGEVDQAEAALLQVLAMHERAHGPRHTTVADTLRNLGVVQDARGEYEAARATLERALEIRRHLLGDGHPDVAILLGILALVHRHTGELGAAHDLYTRALAIRERTLPAGHPEIAGNHRNLALVAALRGDVAAARVHLERAASSSAAELAEARFAAARAWWAASPRDRPAARALAELAREGHAAAGKDAERAAVDAWLTNHVAP